jgi:FG-GAP-like repeat
VANAISGGITVLQGNQSGGVANGTFSIPSPDINLGTNKPSHVAIAYINADTHLDLAVASTSGNKIVFLLGDGEGGFDEAAEVLDVKGADEAAGPQAVDLMDLDGDGADDLVVVNTWGDVVKVYAGGGDGSFSETQVLPVKPNSQAKAFALGHFNLDGKVDMVVMHGNTTEPYILSLFRGK